MSIDGTTEVEIHHVIKKDKGFEKTLFDFSSSMSGAIIQYRDLLYYAVEVTSEKEALEKKLAKAVEALEATYAFAGHQYSCKMKVGEGMESCTCMLKKAEIVLKEVKGGV